MINYTLINVPVFINIDLFFINRRLYRFFTVFFLPCFVVYLSRGRITRKRTYTPYSYKQEVVK